MTEDLPTEYRDYVMPTYGRFDLCIERGDGSRVWDFEGREYLDFGGGIAVCSLGHAHPRVTAAISDQAARLVHSSNLYHTAPQAKVAHRLVDIIGLGGKVFCCNSGAEANEGLIKLARRFGNATGGRYEVLTFKNSFHGRTMAGISATGQDKVKVGFAPLLEGFQHLVPGDIDAVRSAISGKTAAILLEPIQGEGGIHLAKPEFLRELRTLCDANNLLLLYDEVQCGLGRTGDWCGWRSIAEQGAEPDAVSWAKGIANGFPLGAFWAGTRDVAGTALCDLLGPGSHGTTYGGNPVACAAALAVFDEIVDRGLLRHTQEAGAYITDKLSRANAPRIHEIRSIGLMIGIEIIAEHDTTGSETPALALTKRLMAAGLLVIPAGERTVRLLPPLNVEFTDLDRAVELLLAELR
jgi:predicted acetylornithine/succinylornithine family transaminase